MPIMALPYLHLTCCGRCLGTEFHCRSPFTDAASNPKIKTTLTQNTLT